MTWESEQEAEGVSAALEQMMGNRPGRAGKPTDGVPPGLDAGYLGTFYRDERTHCVYDPVLLDPDELRRRLASAVGEATANRVVFVASTSPAPLLAEILRAVNRGEWIPASASVSYAMGLDVESGLIELTVDDAALPEVREPLEQLGGDLLRLRGGGPFQRL